MADNCNCADGPCCLMPTPVPKPEFDDGLPAFLGYN